MILITKTIKIELTDEERLIFFEKNRVILFFLFPKNKQTKRILKQEHINKDGTTQKEDTIKLSSFEGLESIPLEIRDKTVTEIAQYIIDLSISAVSLYRTKLMVVVIFVFSSKVPNIQF